MKKKEQDEMKVEKELIEEAEILEKSGELTVKQKCIACLLVGMIIGAVAMSLCWPKRVAKLKNGEEVVASVGDYNVSADEAYSMLKNENAMMRVLDLIDYAILIDKYGETDEADDYAKEQAEIVYNNFQEYYGYSKEDFLSENGYKDEDEFLTYLNHDYYYNKYYKEYLKSKIADKEVTAYYNSSVSGKKKVHLYTKYDDSVDLNDIKKELDKGKSIEKVNEKFKGALYTDLGEITFKDYANYSDTFISNLYSLKKGETSDVFKDGESGESLIYVESAEDKPNFDDIKDELKEMLAEKMGNEDQKLYYQAFIQLREDSGLKFNDTEYKNLYDNFKKEFE